MLFKTQNSKKKYINSLFKNEDPVGGQGKDKRHSRWVGGEKDGISGMPERVAAKKLNIKCKNGF